MNIELVGKGKIIIGLDNFSGLLDRGLLPLWIILQRILVFGCSPFFIRQGDQLTGSRIQVGFRLVAGSVHLIDDLT